jgi:hypothetical protein
VKPPAAACLPTHLDQRSKHFAVAAANCFRFPFERGFPVI